jgi:aspartate racemase
VGAAVALATVAVVRWTNESTSKSRAPRQEGKPSQDPISSSSFSSTTAATAVTTATTATTATSGKTIGQNSSSRRRIGILCGSGPEAGMDMFHKILQLHRKKSGDLSTSDKDAPNVLVLSVSALGGPRTHNDLIHGTRDCAVTWEALKRAIVELAPLVDCFCICCHQLHFFEANIQQLLLSMGQPLSKFVSMVEVTMEYYCQQQPEKDKDDSNTGNPSNLAILGGPITTDLKGRSPYRTLAEMIPTTIHLSEEQRSELLDIIKAVKQIGAVPTVVLQFEELLRELYSQQNVQTAILACTEFPLLSIQDFCRSQGRAMPPIQLVDPTELVALELLSRTQVYDD